jgi:hypothetical protein
MDVADPEACICVVACQCCLFVFLEALICNHTKVKHSFFLGGGCGGEKFCLNLTAEESWFDS